MEKVFFKECFLTDIIKYDALTVWDKLKNGISLELEYRPVPFDEDKKRVFAWFKDNKQKYYIGSLSKEDSNMIEQLIYMEWSNVFICKISIRKPRAKRRSQDRLQIKFFLFFGRYFYAPK